MHLEPPKLSKAPFTSGKRTIEAPGVGTGMTWVQPLFSLLAWSAEDTRKTFALIAKHVDSS